MEFLIGRSMAANITNMLADPDVLTESSIKHLDWYKLLGEEPDAGLGNGGLGRLAACFVESMATLDLPGMGYGLRYDYGIFHQTINNGWQSEQPDNWMFRPDPWEIPRLDHIQKVKLACSFTIRDNEIGVLSGKPSVVLGIPYDRPVIGYGAKTINTLRLWSACAADSFHLADFSHGEFMHAMTQSVAAQSITRVLYPDDSNVRGQNLRFFQEYFLSACSVRDIVRRFRLNNQDWNEFPDKAAIQLNDTHPTLAIAELMHLLLDDFGLGWDQAWSITQRTFAYTNHTLLPEALEKWPVRWFENVIPRHVEIIYEINRRFLDRVRGHWPGEPDRERRMSLLEEGPEKKVRMAYLAVVGSHSTNGVAAIHSDLLRHHLLSDFSEIFPERFNNKTNGVTPRRWLKVANPSLADAITEAIGDGWICRLEELEKLKPLANDSHFRATFRKAKRSAKVRFVDWLLAKTGVHVDPDTLFDSQIKRIHEYKRQLLNALHIVILYNRLLHNPHNEMPRRTFFFAGKAAPAYHLAKVIIKFINNLATAIDADLVARERLKVVFIPDYSVTIAERLIPASDISEQISTAGYEASGTSNMKFMMNGALTVGTRDGATIEMAQEAGEENFFLFGLTAEQVANSRGWYDPHWHYQNDPEIRGALDLVFSGHFNPSEPGIFDPIRDTLLTNGDFYMHLADMRAYSDAHDQVAKLWADPPAFSAKAIHNVASSGKFSSDRAIAQYASEIWNVSPCRSERSGQDPLQHNLPNSK
jgi:starch phosphorylase